MEHTETIFQTRVLGAIAKNKRLESEVAESREIERRLKDQLSEKQNQLQGLQMILDEHESMESVKISTSGGYARLSFELCSGRQVGLLAELDQTSGCVKSVQFETN